MLCRYSQYFARLFILRCVVWHTLPEGHRFHRDFDNHFLGKTMTGPILIVPFTVTRPLYMLHKVPFLPGALGSERILECPTIMLALDSTLLTQVGPISLSLGCRVCWGTKLIPRHFQACLVQLQVCMDTENHTPQKNPYHPLGFDQQLDHVEFSQIEIHWNGLGFLLPLLQFNIPRSIPSLLPVPKTVFRCLGNGRSRVHSCKCQSRWFLRHWSIHCMWMILGPLLKIPVHSPKV